MTPEEIIYFLTVNPIIHNCNQCTVKYIEESNTYEVIQKDNLVGIFYLEEAGKGFVDLTTVDPHYLAENNGRKYTKLAYNEGDPQVYMGNTPAEYKLNNEWLLVLIYEKLGQLFCKLNRYKHPGIKPIANPRK